MKRLLATLAAAAAAAPFALATAPPSDAPERRTLRLHYASADRDTGRYQYVPVRIAKGTTRMAIACRYDKAGGANAVDLGLFEPGPLALGTRGFRGWSGGARDQVVVAVDEATPGYWPGALPAGEWHVALGLYRVAREGVDVELSIETMRGGRGPTPVLAPPPHEPIRRGEAWYAGDLHVHTLHSDGTVRAAAAARAARDAGLDFIAITDHNNTTHQLETIDVPGLLVIAGEEVTTPAGHANVWGLRGWRREVDFRALPGPGAIEPLVGAARARGALFSINHPVLDCGGCAWQHDIPAGIESVEIWNGPLAPPRGPIELWDGLLRQGRRIAGVGSSDWHRASAPLGRASVRVKAAELSAAVILAAIRAGRVVVMADARTPPPVLTARAGAAAAGMGDTLRLRAGEALDVEVVAPDDAFVNSRVALVADGQAAGVAPLSPGAPARFARVGATRYVRAEVRAADGALLALTNPVYVVAESRAAR